MLDTVIQGGRGLRKLKTGKEDWLADVHVDEVLFILEHRPPGAILPVGFTLLFDFCCRFTLINWFFCLHFPETEPTISLPTGPKLFNKDDASPFHITAV